MSRISNHNCLEVGDVVRVLQNNGKAGDTLYLIVSKDAAYTRGINCTISEIGPGGKLYAPQGFDTSLLKLEPDARKTAEAMNASGAFRPFTVVGK